MVLQFENEPELREDQAALFNFDTGAGGWLLLNHVAGKHYNVVRYAAKRTEGPKEIRSLFEKDQIQ